MKPEISSGETPETLLDFACHSAKLGGWQLHLDSRKLVWEGAVAAIHGKPPGYAPELEEALAFYPMEYRPMIDTTLRECIENQKPFVFEAEIIVEEGTRLWVCVHGEPVLDAEGRVESVRGWFQDISEIIALRKQNEERFRLMARATNDALWEWEIDSNLLWWGDGFETLFGFRLDEIEDTLDSWTKRIHPEDRERVLEGLHAVMEREKGSDAAWIDEYRFARKDGTHAWVMDRGHVIRDEEGRPLRMVGGMTDFSERKKLEQQLLRSQRIESLGTLAAGIAHDLNNLLAPILMGVGLLKQQPMDGNATKILASMQRSAERGTELVKQILSFVRGSEGERRELSVRKVVEEIEQLLENSFPKNIRVHVSVAAGTSNIFADPTRLHQVLLNLCLNARDAMPKGGQLAIQVENCTLGSSELLTGCRELPMGDYVVFSIADSGCGMSQEVLGRVFEPFFTTKEPGHGTGLGLSAALTIVHSHGGTIHAYSEPENGSVFRVSLPVMKKENLTGGQRAGENAEIPSGSGETLLVVDDETAVLDLCRNALEAHGYHVLTAENGARAVALYTMNRKEVALVVTDLMMPVMDGIALVHALHGMSRSIPIIAMSGLHSNSENIESIEHGTVDFLPKPFTVEALLRSVSKNLHRSKM